MKLKGSFVSLLSILIALVLVEGGVRLMSRTDANGDIFIGSIMLRPYHLPVTTTERWMRTYEQSSNTRIEYDPFLGWRPRRHMQTVDGMYTYNTQGVRVANIDQEIPLKKRHALRIVLLGDSFTHGDDVPYEQSWGTLLEKKLRKHGVDAEVLNFGVSGYGMDQSFIRWQLEAAQFKPDIVLFGFQGENVKRNLNIFRPLYQYNGEKADIPFSKPRFFLTSTGLELLNSPALTPQEMVAVFNGSRSAELLARDFYYDVANYRQGWIVSRFVSFLTTVLAVNNRYAQTKRELMLYDPSSESGMLTLAIVRAWRDEAVHSGAQFFLVHLPAQSHLKMLRRRQVVPYQNIMNILEQEMPVIHTEQAFLKTVENGVSIDSLFRGHYSASGSEIVAQAVSETLIGQKEAHQ